MKIALFGYGKMGKLVEAVAEELGHTIALKITQRSPESLTGRALLKEVDVAIDFSSAACVIDHLKICLEAKTPLVIGTTGWEEQLNEAKQRVEQAGGSCLYSPNFSIGLFLFQQMVRHAASLMRPLEEYDVAGLELHHRHKKDAPSGTAKMLTQTVQKEMDRLQGFEFTSIRCGEVTGTHTLLFDSFCDSIELSHIAKNRAGFAKGAVVAAKWLLSKQGFFLGEEMMQDLIKRGNL